MYYYHCNTLFDQRMVLFVQVWLLTYSVCILVVTVVLSQSTDPSGPLITVTKQQKYEFNFHHLSMMCVCQNYKEKTEKHLQGKTQVNLPCEHSFIIHRHTPPDSGNVTLRNVTLPKHSQYKTLLFFPLNSCVIQFQWEHTTDLGREREKVEKKEQAGDGIFFLTLCEWIAKEKTGAELYHTIKCNRSETHKQVLWISCGYNTNIQYVKVKCNFFIPVASDLSAALLNARKRPGSRHS